MRAVDIITPAHNAAGTIAQAIESVLAQRFEDWTLWIVDDGSSDATSQIAERYLDDQRVRLIRQPNRGAASARNLGLKWAKAGKYVAFVDADDYWEPGFLARTVPILEADERVGLVWCDMAIFGNGASGTYREGRPPIAGTAAETLDAIYTGVTFLPSCTLFRASYFREGLRWRVECSPMEDMPIFCAVASRSSIAYVGETLANYRIHEGSTTCSRGAIGRNYRSMAFTFRLLYREYRRYIPRQSYRWRLWWIHHHAADNLACEGRLPFTLLLRALAYRPSAAVSWKVLAQCVARCVRRNGQRAGLDTARRTAEHAAFDTSHGSNVVSQDAQEGRRAAARLL